MVGHGWPFKHEREHMIWFFTWVDHHGWKRAADPASLSQAKRWATQYRRTGHKVAWFAFDEGRWSVG